MKMKGVIIRRSVIGLMDLMLLFGPPVLRASDIARKQDSEQNRNYGGQFVAAERRSY
jgi:hypothetical protein